MNVGRRRLKRWDDRDCWWMDLSESVCRQSNIETGDQVKLTLKIAAETLPVELAQLIRKNAKARAVGEINGGPAANVA